MKPSPIKKKVLDAMLDHIHRTNPLQDIVPTAMTVQELKDMGASLSEGKWMYSHAVMTDNGWVDRRFQLLPRVGN